ncbi:hypothetical protein GKZ68_20340 [Hymenobacter sp. BRD128]|uniref:Wadjet anti-phage system protein JetD domain-containing protein n=1 Tax=Hymenobacter sp. BRD128 TaxID=2675878 RepID=UPI001566A786|nr:DUF3322 and DUF2220 domain-containing protein [Hymenobacter sp. BRD128]QKG58769.1 hypothetical protein GKZ68_20340 [Hymenobacter sp. BRD128]
MLTLAELRRKAEKKYLAALRVSLPLEVKGLSEASATDAQPTLFPLHISCGKLTEAEVSGGKWLHTIAQLEKYAQPAGRSGYTLRQERVNTRTSQAWQTLPQEAIFATPNDLFAFLGKTKEAAHFQQDAALVLARLPQLSKWLQQHPQVVLDQVGKWESLLRVCEFFLAASADSAAPQRYLRELRIEGIHTKFIEQHTRPLRLLLDELLPSNALRYQEAKFLRRYGLREAEPLVRLRLLDESLTDSLPFQLDDVALPVSKFRELAVPCQTVFIVENLTTFLALPPLPATVAVWGKGFQVGVLVGSAWAITRRILYWGDLDAAGFQILNQLRAHFSHAHAVLMDAATLTRYINHHSHPSKPVKPQLLAHLTYSEKKIFDYLVSSNLRLEQEHLPQEELLAALSHYYVSQEIKNKAS